MSLFYVFSVLKFLFERCLHLCCHGQFLQIGGFAAEFGRGPSADIDRKLTLLRDIQIHAAQPSLTPTFTLDLDLDLLTSGPVYA